MANGALGSFNGGIIMGVWPPAGLRASDQWTHALLPFADSGAHFMYAMRELSNFTTDAVREWGERQFFGPSIDQWPQWPSVGGVGKWAGLSKLAQQIRIEVASVKWRTEGWVALRATGMDASVTTVPLTVSAGSGCNKTSKVGASINIRGGEVTVDLVDRSGKPLDGFSGSSASRINTDDVAAPLLFGGRRFLPPIVHGGGVAFHVRMSAGAELFGISLRCVSVAHTGAAMKHDDATSWIKFDDSSPPASQSGTRAVRTGPSQNCTHYEGEPTGQPVSTEQQLASHRCVIL